MTKDELKAEISEAFARQPYPQGDDFFKAVAHRDYLEYTPTSRRKEWQDLSESEILKFYDFLFFLGDAGVVYYIPAYMFHVLDSLEVAEEYPSETLFMALGSVSKECFDDKQRDVVLLFLRFCRAMLEQGVEMNEDLLERALAAISGSGNSKPL